MTLLQKRNNVRKKKSEGRKLTKVIEFVRNENELAGWKGRQKSNERKKVESCFFNQIIKVWW